MLLAYLIVMVLAVMAVNTIDCFNDAPDIKQAVWSDIK